MNKSQQYYTSDVNVMTTCPVKAAFPPLLPPPPHPSALYGLSVHIAVQTYSQEECCFEGWSRDPKQEENVNRHWWPVTEKSSEKFQP
jgi:hypothetical protein